MKETLIFQRFLPLKQEAQTGFEPVNQGVADPCLTTWLLRHDDTKSYKIVNVLAQVLVVLQTHALPLGYCA